MDRTGRTRRPRRHQRACRPRSGQPADEAIRPAVHDIRAGLARGFRRIIDAAARAHGVDPGTATWQ